MWVNFYKMRVNFSFTEADFQTNQLNVMCNLTGGGKKKKVERFAYCPGQACKYEISAGSINDSLQSD